MYMTVDKFNQKTRIRIRYPDGFEVEIEGDKDFVIQEKENILKEIKQKTTEQIQYEDMKTSLSRIIDFKENIPYLKIKLPDLDEKMAMLILLTSYLKILSIENVEALDLSKSLKLSGYMVKRIDQIAKNLIKDGSVTAFGTKRNRSYSLTPKGIAKSSVKVLNIIENIKNNKK